MPFRTSPGPTSVAPATQTRLSLWGPVVAYMGLIFVISSINIGPALPGGMSDKGAHLLEYAALGALTMRALSGGTWAGVRLRAIAGTVLIAAAYGLGDELHQFLVPGRQFDLRDLVADAAGATAAAVALWAWGIIRRFSAS